MQTKAGSEQDVVDLLVSQHQQIKNLFAEVSAATGERKKELFHDLVRLLAVHESAEEQVVHPTARRKIADGEPIVSARLAEEDEAKHALAELYDLGADHPDFDMRLRDFADSVMKHANAEEEEEFRQLRTTLKPEELTRMAGVVRAAEAAAPTRPHPAAGESAAANIIMGPPLALFDRVRDAVRDWSRS
jgi:hemerythrin superfamily protein